MAETILYRLYAQHKITNQQVLGLIAETIEELSYGLPTTGNGKDHALMHSDIKRPEDWDVIVMGLDGSSGNWIEVEDPRFIIEDSVN